MPHGGYHGKVVSGGQTIQQASTPDDQGVHSGGGQYKAEGWDKPKWKPQVVIPKVETGDARDDWRTNQAWRAQQDKNFLKQKEEELRAKIEQQAKTGTIDKSDITGYKDGILGLRIGDYKDTGKWIVNPATHNRIFVEKARQGLTSPEYLEWIQEKILKDQAGKKAWGGAFPIQSSGLGIGNLVEKLLPLPFKIGIDLLKKTGVNKVGNTLKDKISNVLGISSTDEAKPFIPATSSDFSSGIEVGKDPILDMVEEPVALDIETIKDNKLRTKNKLSLTDQDKINFTNALKEPWKINQLPQNFENTFKIMRDAGELNSSDYLKALELLKNVVPTGINLEDSLNINQNMPLPTLGPIYSTPQGIDNVLLSKLGNYPTGAITPTGVGNQPLNLFYNQVV
jgi:hypothetical protein